MSSIHTFNIETTEPQAVRNGGTRTMANKRNFSLLKGMVLYSLRLYSGEHEVQFGTVPNSDSYSDFDYSQVGHAHNITL